MANQIYNEPIDRTVDWGGDESTGNLPVSGAMVQKFIKDTFNTKYGYVRIVGDVEQFFACEEDAGKYDENPDDNVALLLKQVTLPAGGSSVTSQYYVRTINNLDSRNFAVSQGKACYLKFTYQSQVKPSPDLPYEDTQERGYVTVFARMKGKEYEQVMDFYCQSGEMNTIDVAEYLGSGDNDVMIRITGEETNESAPALTYTITLTSLSISAKNFDWWRPFTTDINIPYIIGGNIEKILKIAVTRLEDGSITTQDINIGKTVYTETAYGFNLPHPEQPGVYNVSAYVQNVSGTITTESVSYNIICVEEDGDGKYIAINEVVDKLTNWSDNIVLYYTIYDNNKSYSEITFDYYKDGVLLSSVENGSVVTGSKTMFNMPLEIDTIDNSNFDINLTVKDTKTTFYEFTFDVDNSKGYSAMPGAVFYMNPKKRNNSQTNREYVIDEITGKEIKTTWTNIGWDNDGWSVDEEGNKCLRLYSGSQANINYQPFKEEAVKKGKTIEVDFCARNVSDEDAVAINLMKSNVGLKVTPNKVTALSQIATNIDSQSVNIQDSERIRLHYVIMPNAYGNNGFNLCFIYINGVKNRTFLFENNDYFSNTQNIILGCTGADLDIYGLRVYDSALSSTGVQTNIINWETSTERREQLLRKNDVFNADGTEIDIMKIKGVMNCFVFSGDIPSYTDKDVTGKGDLELFWAEHPEWNSVVHNCKAEGQGTSSKKYYKWNLRWKLKKEVVEYADGTPSTTGTWRFVPGQPYISKATAKLNWASSMQSHKIGSVNSMNDLVEIMGIINEANSRITVYQYPFVGFSKSYNEEGEAVYTFLGLYTFGPDKGDDNTFGYDDKKYPNLISVEGADNAPLAALFRVPWKDKIVYNEKEESFQYNGENSWDFNAGDLDKIGTFIDAYNFVYECSPRLLPFDGTLAELNLVKDEYKTSSYDYWLVDEDDVVVYYEASEGAFIYADTGKGKIHLKEQLLDKGYGLTSENISHDLTKRNKQYINARIEKFRQEMQNYWKLDDSIFQRNWVEFNAATDNRAKNTYPYMFTLLYGWRGDDMDTIWPINNQGQSSKGYWVEIHDTYDNGGPVWNGETSNFWNLLDLAFPEEVKKGMGAYMKAMEDLSGVSKGNSFDKIYGFFKKYYFDNAQEYFPQSLYNTTAKELYETAKIAQKDGNYTNDTDPITQSLGDHYSAERRWLSKRIPYMMSKYGFGDFSNGGNDAIIVRVAGDMIKYDITPAIWLYPCIAHGTSLVQGERTRAGQTCSIEINMSGSADQQNGILGANYLMDIGEWYDKNVTGEMVVTGKMLTNLKLGHKHNDITISITGLSISNTPALKYLMLSRISTLSGSIDLTGCKRLEECYLDGTRITQPKFANGGGLKKVEFGSETKYVIFKNMSMLTNSGVDINSCKKSITDFAVTDCVGMNPVNMLYEIYTAQNKNHNLKRIRCVGFDEHVPDATIDMLYEMSKGGFNGMDSDGIGTSGLPVFEGTIRVNNAAELTVNRVRELYPQLEIIVDNLVVPTGYTVKFTSATSFYENQVIQLKAESSNDLYPEIEYLYVNSTDFADGDVTVDKNTGLVNLNIDYTNESYNRRFTVRATSLHNKNVYVNQVITIIGQRVTSIEIKSDSEVLFAGSNISVMLGATGHTKPYTVVYTTTDDELVQIDGDGNVSVMSDRISTVTVRASYGLDDSVYGEKTFLINDGIVADNDSNRQLCNLMFINGWSASSNEVYASECFAVKSISVTNFDNSGIEDFEALQYFGTTTLPVRVFSTCKSLKRLVIPHHMKLTNLLGISSELDYFECRSKNVNMYAISGVSIKELNLHYDLLNSDLFYFIDDVVVLRLNEGVTTIPRIRTSELKTVYIPSTALYCDGIESDNNGVSSFNIEFIITEGSGFGYNEYCLTDADNTIIYKYNLSATYTIPLNIQHIGPYAFAGCDTDETITCHDNINDFGEYSFLGSRVNISYIKNAYNSAFKNTIINTDGNLYISGAMDYYVFQFATIDADNIYVNCEMKGQFFDRTSVNDLAVIHIDKNTKCNVDVAVNEHSCFANAIIKYNGDIASYVSTKYIGLITSASNNVYINNIQIFGELVIPSAVNKIESGALVYCNFTPEIKCTNPITIGKYGCAYANIYSINNVHSIEEHAFFQSMIEDVEFSDNTGSIGEFAFYACKELNNLYIEDGITIVPQSCFCNCEKLSTLRLPKTITTIGNNVFHGCVNLKELRCESIIAPVVNSNSFGSSGSYIGQQVFDKKLYIPMTSTGYDESYWSSILIEPTVCNFIRHDIYEPAECIELVITADNVPGWKSNTTVYYTALTNGYDPCEERYITDYELSGKDISDDFGVNPSYTDSRTLEISYTYLNKTVSTTIEQSPNSDVYYDVVLNDQWRINGVDETNPDSALYDGMYESFANYNMHSVNAVMYIDITGYNRFTILVRSSGEPSYDYLIVSKLDTDIIVGNGSTIEYSTTNEYNTKTGVAGISDYKSVVFENIDEGTHRISIMYRKDTSGSSYDDRGYVLIPKNQ